MKRVLYLISLLVLSAGISAREQQKAQKDESRLLRLISANSAEIVQLPDGRTYRKVSGNAQFVHNNTFIICDSAIWDVVTNILDAKGNVQIIQKNTRLTSDLIHYVADANLAEFRGHLVELTDKDNNRLRTMIMDYHTKDSVAIFNYGGAILTKDSNAIESITGVYDAKKRMYKFAGSVEIKNDSLSMKSDSVLYFPETENIHFLGKSLGWRGSDFMRFSKGLYDRKKELYRFSGGVYMNTPDQEIWADSLIFQKRISNAELFRSVQIIDTAQSAIFFGDYGRYLDNPQSALLTKNASAAYYSFDKGVADTLFINADTLRYDSKLYSQTDSVERSNAEFRATLANKDAFESLLKTLEKQAPVKKGAAPAGPKPQPKDSSAKQVAAAAPPSDTLSARNIDSSAHSKPDSSAVVKTPHFADTTTIRYLHAYHKVKIHRSNLQGVCDSLVFTSLDSLARLYGDPRLWNENNQFTSDSIQLLIKNRAVYKVELMSRAYTIAKQDSVHYNQIKGADIIGYFTNNEISRFDALGGVSVVFFFSEDSVITTMNQKECRAMKALISENKIQRVKYIQEIESDAFPIVTLSAAKMKLKGFNWNESDRPANRFEVCDRSVNKSERESVSEIPLPYFNHTNRFFQFKTRYLPDIKR